MCHYAERTDPRDGRCVTTVGSLRDLDVLGLDEESFVERVTTDVPPRPANHRQIIETDPGKRDVTDEVAFELELGPNSCAA